MRKFLPHILILVIVVGVLAPTHVAHAQLGWLFSGAVDTVFTLVTPIIQVIIGAVLKLLSFITGISGLLLDYVLSFTVVNMKTNISDLTGINIAWKILRDLMNIAFVFLLVYEGIKMIIGQSDTGKIKSIISFIVLASILINFSLFFTKVMIDASNIVTIGFYKAILGSNSEAIGKGTAGLSTSLTKALGLSSLWTVAGADVAMGGPTNPGGVLIFGLGTGFVMIVSFFVFLAISCLFVVRYIALIILMMLSPIAYMGSALPFMKTYSDQWWKAFNSQLLFAPIYMIMTWVILTLMSSPGFLSQGSFAQIFATNAGGKPDFELMKILMNFAIIIGLLIASLVIAKKTASEGHGLLKDATGKLTGRATAFAGGALLGGAAGIGRGTVGRWGSNQANDDELKGRIARGEASRMERIKFAAGTKAASASFDVRKTGMASGLASTAGVDLGKGTKGIPFMGNDKAGEGGHKKAIEEAVKKEKAYMDSLKPSDEAEEAYKAKAKKEALEALADPVKKEELNRLNKEASDKHFEEHPEELTDLLNARAKLQEAATKALEEKAAVDKTSEETGAQIAQSEANLKQLQKDLDGAKALYKDPNDPNVKAKQDALDAEKTKKDSLDRQGANEKEALKASVKAHEEATKAIKANEGAEAEMRGKIQSKEFKEVVANSQGKGQTLHQQRAEQYASKFEDRAKAIKEADSGGDHFWFDPSGMVKPITSRIWNGSVERNRAVAAAVRKSAKGKSAEQNLLEMAKKLKKEMEAKGQKVDDGDDGDEGVKPAVETATKESTAEAAEAGGGAA